MSAHDDSRLRFVVCWRPIPARMGEEHAVTKILRHLRHRTIQSDDGHLDLEEIDVVIILENCRWFPTIAASLAARRAAARMPLVVVWHWEPLPLPRAAGLPPPTLSLRERVKIIFGDMRATDPYTNFSHLSRMSRQGSYDLLIVSSQAWQESLLEHGISCHWVPYGYESGDGAPASAPRDIPALFLGAVNIPRRKRIIGELRRKGVALVAKGSWFKRALWSSERARLINRADTLINIQRYRGEISAHRLILGMANRALVVSEPIYRPTPFIPGEHYVEAEVCDMPATLDYYRTHRDERDRIVDRAYRFVTEELTMESSVSRILSLVGARIAMADERPR